MIFGCDLETSDLNPELGEILEIGVMRITDDFEPIDHFSVVVERDPEKPMSPCVEKMHTNNGLLAECDSAGLPLEVAVQLALGWMRDKDHEPRDRRSHPMFGNSTHFDREWLKAKAPDLDQFWGYRLLDVSSLCTFLEGLGANMPERSDEYSHRAIGDLHRSCQLARACRDFVLQTGPGRRTKERAAKLLNLFETSIPLNDNIARQAAQIQGLRRSILELP